MQVIYLYQKPVVLSQPEETLPEHVSSFEKIHFQKQNNLSAKISLLKEDKLSGLIVFCKTPEEVWGYLFQYFQHWQAAGGLVVHSDGELLLLFRKGKWDLPKGKKEKGERMEETALREVTEETGLKNIHIEKELTDTWHSYPISVYGESHPASQKDILKQTRWFLMSFSGTELTVPQIEEDIIDIQWIKPIHLKRYLSFSYSNIQQVFEAAGYIPSVSSSI